MGFMGLGAIQGAMQGTTQDSQQAQSSRSKKQQAVDQMPGQPKIEATTTPLMNQLPMYDSGGDVPEDQVAIVHKDERVLTPEEADQYRQEHPEKVETADNRPPSPLGAIPNVQPSSQMRPLPHIDTPKMSGATDHPDAPQADPNKIVDAGSPEAAAVARIKPITGVPKPSPTEMQKLGSYQEATKEDAPAPDPMAIVQQDKLAAMQKGTAGLTDLGTSLIHEKALGGKAAPDGPNLPPEEPVMPAYTGMQRLGKGTPGEAETAKQFQDKLHEYDTRIQAAMDQGTPEGDREAASLNLAKQHFQKMNPYGSTANHPGTLGKIEHGLVKGLNIAGNIAGPAEMSLIPGTELNKERQARQFRAQEESATKEGLEQAQARFAGGKTPQEQDMRALQNTINPETLPNGPKYDPKFPQGRNYTLPEAYEESAVPGKGAEVTYARNAVKNGDAKSYAEGVEQYHKMLAGNKLNEHEKRVADYISSHHMEDTPDNREKARIAIETADIEAKQQAALPFSEAKAKFNSDLATTRERLQQANADAYARGLKSDELQNTENARSSAVTAKLQTAKDALADADDEQFAAQIAPVLALLATTSTEGVKRVNKQELDKFVPSGGSFGRWVDAHAEQFLEGKIPAEYRSEVGHMLDRMTAAETAEHIINTHSIDETVRQGAQTPVQNPGGGAGEKPKTSPPSIPPPTAPSTGGFAEWKKAQEKKK